MASTADHPRSATRSSLTELVSFASASHARAAVILIALSLIAFLPGFFQIPPIDREEARFAQASKQMIESGDYLDTRFQNQVRSKNFPGANWLQTVAVSAADAAGFAARTDEHLALSTAVIIRRDRRRVADLLGGARFRFPPRVADRGGHDGDVAVARRPGAAGQGRRSSPALRRGCDGRARARLSQRRGASLAKLCPFMSLQFSGPRSPPAS